MGYGRGDDVICADASGSCLCLYLSFLSRPPPNLLAYGPYLYIRSASQTRTSSISRNFYIAVDGLLLLSGCLLLGLLSSPLLYSTYQTGRSTRFVYLTLPPLLLVDEHLVASPWPRSLTTSSLLLPLLYFLSPHDCARIYMIV